MRVTNSASHRYRPKFDECRSPSANGDAISSTAVAIGNAVSHKWSDSEATAKLSSVDQSSAFTQGLPTLRRAGISQTHDYLWRPCQVRVG
jgi:hypothetical protein